LGKGCDAAIFPLESGFNYTLLKDQAQSNDQKQYCVRKQKHFIGK